MDPAQLDGFGTLELEIPRLGWATRPTWSSAPSPFAIKLDASTEENGSATFSLN